MDNKKKKIIFVLLVFVISIIILIKFSGFRNLTFLNNKMFSISKVSKTSKNRKIFKVGEIANVDGIQLLINDVNISQGSAYLNPEVGKQYIFINLTIINKNNKKLVYKPSNFILEDNKNQTSLSEYLLDEDGNDLVSNPLNEGCLSKNGSITGTLVGQGTKGNKYKLIYYPNKLHEKRKIIFELN